MIIDARIRLQKAVIAANRLPDVNVHHHDPASELTLHQDKILGAALESDAPRRSVKRLYEEAFGLSDDVLKLRKVYFQQLSNIAPIHGGAKGALVLKRRY